MGFWHRKRLEIQLLELVSNFADSPEVSVSGILTSSSQKRLLISQGEAAEDGRN